MLFISISLFAVPLPFSLLLIELKCPCKEQFITVRDSVLRKAQR